jgi:guanylate kinase
MPDRSGARDIVLEIEVDGATQVKRQFPDAVLIFVLPPSREEQQRRLRGRGDPEEKVDARLQKAVDEEPVGLAIADHVVVNDDLADTVREMMGIIVTHREKQHAG